MLAATHLRMAQPKTRGKVSVVKCEQFQNLGGGQTVVHSITVHLLHVFDHFLDKNWGKVGRGDSKKDCSNLSVTVPNTQEGQLSK